MKSSPEEEDLNETNDGGTEIETSSFSSFLKEKC